MTNELIAATTALWLGILTSISPCPLATNVAAVSLLARKAHNKRRACAGAIAYTLGRVVVYIGLATILMTGLTSMPTLSSFLRNEIVPLIGPILILAGMAVVGLLPIPANFRLGNAQFADKLTRYGILGEFCLGGLFALSFCPVSAALFFGSLMPIAMTSNFPPLLVASYGLGTALPVGVIALLLALSAAKASKALQRIQHLQNAAVNLTGAILIGVGIWLTLSDTLHIL
ncbi:MULTISPECIES: aromatic aminobenezylarsenical efflux permease ArsG family transporter [unclassified Lentimonas]|uniref:aromatic aminobenezylarsenical efflux permease ArsG family transporter n=1 Tax=unclassified Lentimonas TaxID=2630993 RepID=UPI00132BA809|nr:MULTISPECIES: aromatic aminobenezylarsenical efflux permease ArsG family transporter [unclassified Lentimonas]CAA6690067.1 Unannotated [Lentimonas sp. CC19]CAA6690995.1 Unannotated [Lentimonas sp. CC10]CAA7070679.1 Unannotated [Lentimonas sp. CC11]